MSFLENVDRVTYTIRYVADKNIRDLGQNPCTKAHNKNIYVFVMINDAPF